MTDLDASEVGETQHKDKNVPKGKKAANGRGKGKSTERQTLSYDDVWDDTELIDAWDAAVKEYQQYHSPYRDKSKPPEAVEIKSIGKKRKSTGNTNNANTPKKQHVAPTSQGPSVDDYEETTQSEPVTATTQVTETIEVMEEEKTDTVLDAQEEDASPTEEPIEKADEAPETSWAQQHPDYYSYYPHSAHYPPSQVPQPPIPLVFPPMFHYPPYPPLAHYMYPPSTPYYPPPPAPMPKSDAKSKPIGKYTDMPPEQPSHPSIPIDQEGLTNLLMAWYYSGYYTGLYQASLYCMHKQAHPERLSTRLVIKAKATNCSHHLQEITRILAGLLSWRC